ncbi:multiphosphoryl transfer protein [Pasteurella multocida]|nr:multiphosphoryl transfer protein [Pasteurella multocida]
MFNLHHNDIHLSAQANDKEQAITIVAQALTEAGYVDSGYLKGMLEREKQTTTYLGNGIAIPHGTLETRHLVKKTGVQIFQFPQGIAWGDGNIAYIVIGIAAHSDEHLALLRQLTHILSEEEIAAQLATTQDVQHFHKLLSGQSDEVEIKPESINLNIETTSLLALTALNAGQLEQQQAVNTEFVKEVITNSALPLTEGLWLTDAVIGNQKNAIAFSRAKTAFENNGKKVIGVLTISAVNDHIDSSLTRLLDSEVQKTLLNGDVNSILNSLNGNSIHQQTPEQSAVKNQQEMHTEATDGIEAVFVIQNEHGLHARPAAILVNEVKKYNASVTVQNLDRGTPLISAKSLMKVVALGTVKGNRLRFIATGEQAKQAIEGIGAIIASGLGE